jgi:nucleoside 2-deoxyribosyltransferase
MELLCTPGTVVFVASGWPERENAAKLMRELEKRGLVVAHDWTRGTQGGDRGKTATSDLAGVKRAQVLIAVMTDAKYEYKGTWFETGCAVGSGIPTILISPFTKAEDAVTARNVYFHLPSHTRFNSVDAMLTQIDARI